MPLVGFEGGQRLFDGRGTLTARAVGCGGKQRKIIGETRERARLLALLQGRQDLLGARHRGGGQPGELRHMNAVAAVGGARRHLMQEDHIALPLLDSHGVGRQRG